MTDALPSLARVIDPIEADITRLAEEAEGRRRELPQRCDLECYWQGRRDALVALLQAGSPFLAAVQHLRAEQKLLTEERDLARYSRAVMCERAEAAEADLTALRSKHDDLIRQEVPLGCNRQPWMSRICQRGTQCCTVDHSKPDGLAALRSAVRAVEQEMWDMAQRGEHAHSVTLMDWYARLAASVQEPK